MNKKIKAKWLRALRSGAYRKGKDQLCRPGTNVDKFCCLGVLWEEMGHEWEEGDFRRALLPNNFARHVGLTEAQQKRLVRLNDGSSTFEIVIEAIEDGL